MSLPEIKIINYHHLCFEENEYIGRGSPLSNPFEITDEMHEGARMFRDAVHAALAGSGHQVHVENAVTCRTLHPDCWGTPDAWVWQTTTHLHIWDYKFGHLFVDRIDVSRVQSFLLDRCRAPRCRLCEFGSALWMFSINRRQSFPILEQINFGQKPLQIRVVFRNQFCVLVGLVQAR